MQDTFLSEMRQLLQTQQASLAADIARQRSLTALEETQSEHAGLGNHMADDATEMFEQEKNLSLLQHTTHLLAKVEAALRQMDAGSYGSCERCGNTIDHARLETLPYATLCVSCKARQERA